jgi:hypothetical protein
VLDGGHILLAGIEALTGRGLNPGILRWVQTSCALALMSLVLYLTFFDLQDTSWRGTKNQPIIFAPKIGAQSSFEATIR